MKSLNELFREVILLNEVSGNEKAILRFSDPDGPSGRSGWSFGLCQFDTKHNDSSIMCLRECGFAAWEIIGIQNQDIDVKPLARKLVPEIVARYDEAQLSLCLLSALNTTTATGIMVVDTAPILALADYVNQYGSIGPSFVHYLNDRDINRNITIQDIQDWKLTTEYGQKHKADCERRYDNVLKVMAGV